MNIFSIRGFFIALLFSLGAFPLHATIFYVTPTGSGTGSSWSDASSDLKQILDLALAGDEVWVAAGTYCPTDDPTAPTATYVSFEINDGVALYGGFDGTETLLSQRDFLNHRTILSGDLLGNDTDDFDLNRSDNSRIVLDAVSTSAATLVDGFVISGGDGYSGAGMLANSSSVVVRNVLFTSNYGTGFGSGFYSVAGNPRLENVYFINNESLMGGGGLAIGAGSLSKSHKATITGCVFIDNLSSFYGTGRGGGGALIESDSTVSVLNCRFVENSTNLKGGGLRLLGRGAHVVEGCYFKGNAAVTGGGISHVAKNASYNSCLWVGNTASQDGGAFHSSRTMDMQNCGFLANESADKGGAFYGQLDGLASDGAFLYNCIFWGNKAQDGGAVNSHRDIDFINCTFTGNSDLLGAGALSAYSTSIYAAEIGLYNSIVWSNSSNFTGNVSATFSCIEGGYAGTGNIAADPQFVSTPDYTAAPSRNGDINFGSTSPVIDAGNNTYLPTGLTLDAFGAPRVVGAVVDMGAVEFQATSSTRNSIADETNVISIGSDLVLYLGDDEAELIEVFNTGGQLVYTARISSAMHSYSLANVGLTGLNHIVVSGPDGVKMKSVFIP